MHLITGIIANIQRIPMPLSHDKINFQLGITSNHDIQVYTSQVLNELLNSK